MASSSKSPEVINKKNCKCDLHGRTVNRFDEFECNNLVSLDNRKSPHSPTIRRIAEKGYLDQYMMNTTRHVSRGGWICTGCIKYMEAVVEENEPRKRTKIMTSEVSDEVESFVRKILNNEFTDCELAYVAKAIGSVIAVDVKARASEKILLERRSRMLTSSYDKIWNGEQNLVFKSFLDSLIDYSHDPIQRQTIIRRYLVKASESVYCALNSHYISAPTLAENLVLYYYSGSKTCANLFGNVQAGGHYHTLLSTVATMAEDKPTFPVGDIVVVFDNNQMIDRHYRIFLDSKLKESTVTGISVLEDEHPTNYQAKTKIPTIFKTPVVSHQEWSTKYHVFIESCNTTHRIYRKKFIKTRLEKVVRECYLEGEEIYDIVKYNKDLKPKNPVFIPDDAMKNGLEYDRVPFRESSINIYDQECLSFNPNSYQTVAAVLDHILVESDKTATIRKWIVVVCDGLPFGLALSLVKNTYTCPKCEKDVSKTDIQNHSESHKRKPELDSFRRKYNRIVLRPGNGHYEIQFVRCIFSVYFDIYIRPIAEILGFRTPKALEYIKNSHDHHKSWQILTILYEALSDELMYAYVSDCLSNKSNPTLTGLLDWQESVKNPNYIMASQLVFSVLHPLFLFRAGIRQCNAEVALAAREKLAALFYGFNHPKYREINANDIFFLLSLPKSGSNLIQMQSFRRSGGSSGQGADFLLEERNKAQKFWVIYDGTVPTKQQWQRACCSMGELDQIKKAVHQRLGLTDKEHKRHKIDFGPEIMEIRTHFREMNLFYDAAECDLVSATTEQVELRKEFLKLLPDCEMNRDRYYSAFLRGEKVILPLVNSMPVDFTQSEYLSRSDIIKVIRNKIACLPKQLKKNYKLNTNSSMADLQDFHNSLCEELRDQEYEEIQVLHLGG